MKNSILLLLLLIPFFVCAQKKLDKSDLDLLRNYMSGSFTSEQQSKNDSDFFDIHLQMKPIWEERKDCFWLYVEQAIVSALEKPYRQRIYHVNLLNDTTIISEVFEMKSPMRFAGAYKNVAVLNSLTLVQQELRESSYYYRKALRGILS